MEPSKTFMMISLFTILIKTWYVWTCIFVLLVWLDVFHCICLYNELHICTHAHTMQTYTHASLLQNLRKQKSNSHSNFNPWTDRGRNNAPRPTSHLIVILNVLSWIKYLQKFSMQSHYVSYLFYIQRLVLLATKGGTTGSNKVLPTLLFNNITHGNPNMPYPILWFSLEYNLWFASETEEVFFSKGLFRSLLIVGKPLVCD